MSNEQTFTINMNQVAMIKLALYYDDIEMSKLINIAQDYTLSHTKANVYIVEYYKTLFKRFERELSAILESIDATEVYVRTANARKTYDMLDNILNDKKIGFVKANEIDEEEAKNLLNKIAERQKEMESETEEIIKFFRSLQ